MKWSSLFRRSTLGAYWYVALVLVLPLISLCLLGVVLLWQKDLLLWVVSFWLILTLAGYAIFHFLDRRQSRLSGSTATDDDSGDTDSPLPDQLDEQADWSEQDRELWQRLKLEIDRQLHEDIVWKTLPDECIQLLGTVSAHYHPNKPGRRRLKGASAHPEFRFTLPEALLVMSVASARYRTLVLQHVPFAESITVATLISLHERQQNIRTGYTWLNYARRTLRLVNPVAAVVGELRDQFTNRLFAHLNISIQRDLKRLLLQEVVQVGIDLYSGRLKASEAELAQFHSHAHQQDLQRAPSSVEPLRIVLAGQTSAGKSSLINALADVLQAEVDILPGTERLTTYRLQLEDDSPAVHLIDTPGLDQDSSSPNELASLIADTDMMLLVSRANQPARAPDSQLWAALQQHQASRPARRPPPVILVLTHVDQLTPRSQWNPPYSLDDDERKSQSIRAAMQSAVQQIGLPADTPVVPVCTALHREHYNIDAVAAQMMLQYDSATLTQLNRRRIERGEQALSWSERWSQFRGLGRVLGRAITRGTPDVTEEDSSSSSDTQDRPAPTSAIGKQGRRWRQE